MIDLPTRLENVTETIDREESGFNGSIFIHVDYMPSESGRKIYAIRLSEKGKDGSTLDNLLTAIGDKLTDIVRRELSNSEVRT